MIAMSVKFSPVGLGPHYTILFSEYRTLAAYN